MSNDHIAGMVSIRPLLLGWSRAADGQWQYSGDANEELWEVICPACGDDRGPPEAQTEAVRQLRGPYGSQEEAWQVASQHSGPVDNPPDTHVQ